MSARELVLKLAGGNPGVMELLVRLLHKKEFEILRYFDREGIHGSGIWESYEIDDKDFDEWVNTLHAVLALHYNGGEVN